MIRPRYRPTFLLRCIVFSTVVAFGFAVFALAKMAGGGMLLLVALGLGLLLVFWSDLISEGIVALMTWRARRSGVQPSSFWFIDTEEVKERDNRRFYEDTKDNPTFR